jgi:outer membrane murein-binding lipoprotein Lpp
MTGFSNGMYSMRYVVLNTVESVFKAVKNKIADIFDIHSPSGVTTGFGENLDTGMINGMQNNAKQLTSTAATLASAVTDSLTPDDVETPTIDLSSVTNTSLTSLQSWSTSFVEILTNAFTQITTLFDQLSTQLSTSMANIDSISSTLSASTGSIAAADQIGATATTSTGTTTTEQIMAVLTDETLDRMSAKTSAAIYEYIAPLFATLTAAVQDQVIAYIGTLIADDAGLKELYRRLKVIQVSEGRRS